MAKTKTDNFSIRFDLDKLDLIKQREKIDTPQRVVNFLMDKYYWEHKIGNNPITERQQTPQYQPPPKPTMPTQQQIVDPILQPLIDRLYLVKTKLSFDAVMLDAEKLGLNWHQKEKLKNTWASIKESKGLIYNDTNR